MFVFLALGKSFDNRGGKQQRLFLLIKMSYFNPTDVNSRLTTVKIDILHEFEGQDLWFEMF